MPADWKRISESGHRVFAVERGREPVDRRDGEIVDVGFSAADPLGELIEPGDHD
jgi:hypothetical protein